MYARSFAEGFYVLRWGEHEMKDIADILSDVREMRARHGRRIVYVAVQPPDAPSIPGDVRAARNRAIGALLNECERVHLVLQGDSPAMTHARSSASAVLASMHLGDRVLVHARLDEVVTATPEEGRDRARLALRVALSRGVLMRDELG